MTGFSAYFASLSKSSASWWSIASLPKGSFDRAPGGGFKIPAGLTRGVWLDGMSREHVGDTDLTCFLVVCHWSSL